MATRSKKKRLSFLLVASVSVLFVGIWKNVRLSMTIVSTSEREDDTWNDVPTRLEDSATTRMQVSVKEAGHHAMLDHTSTTTTTTDIPSTPPFPRWNNSNGIHWEAIESYIRHADDHLSTGNDLLDCPNGGCPPDMPNVLYIFGAYPHPHHSAMMNGNVSSSNTTTSTSTNNTTTPFVWVERRRRKLVGPGFSKRYPILEELMHLSLEYLLTNQEITRKRYPRLIQHIVPGVANSPTGDGTTTTNNSFLGIPLIMNFGDNRQCHFQNLKKSTTTKQSSEILWQDVPVFTLAVPVDCQFAFPIPHPAALDTAKVYGNRWESILDRRRRVYPVWKNQTRQAVWRGSPTGWPMTMDPSSNHHAASAGRTMRQIMVHTANQLPFENLTLMERVHQMFLAQNATTINDEFAKNDTDYNNNATFFFNVGFGKPFHKIVPAYKGPRIPRQSRIWFEDFAQYRVTLDADGSSWSERFGPLLCLNTLVAKLEPSFVDWLWPTVQANHHFVSIHKDSSNLWSAILPLLEEQGNDGLYDDRQQKGGERIRSNAWEWCLQHMTYERMIQDFLQSLELYVSWLDRGDLEWLKKWERLFLEDMPPKHHHWQALPFEKSKGYFPLWRNDEDRLESEL